MNDKEPEGRLIRLLALCYLTDVFLETQTPVSLPLGKPGQIGAVFGLLESLGVFLQLRAIDPPCQISDLLRATGLHPLPDRQGPNEIACIEKRD